MLVNATRMLKEAHEGHYAVGHFNINNLEWTKAILLTAQELNSPVILGVSEGAGKYMGGFKVVVAMVKALDECLGITVPVALHLDHGTEAGVRACIEAGFTSVMFDGPSRRTSRRPLSSSSSPTTRAFPSKLRSARSAERKTASPGKAKSPIPSKPLP